MDIFALLLDNAFMQSRFAFALILILSTAVLNVKSQPSGKIPNSERPAANSKVLVELFTAEGCPTCPPANKALSLLQKEQPFQSIEVITLAFHVDYWNSRGWVDRFSSPIFSKRQEFYVRRLNVKAAYTPQMVVDGTYQFAGNILSKHGEFITQAAREKKANIGLETGAGNLKVKISEVPKHTDATIFLAIAEDNLFSEVKTKSNSAVKFEHSSVVRELRFVGSLPAVNHSFSAEHQLQLQPHWKKENLRLVVFIQEVQSRRIIGVNSLQLQLTAL